MATTDPIRPSDLRDGAGIARIASATSSSPTLATASVRAGVEPGVDSSPHRAWDRERRAWVFFGAALVALAAALLALIAVWLIHSSRARLAIDARERLEAELRTAREERGTIVTHTQRAGAAAEESARRAEEATSIAESTETELAHANERLRSLEARIGEIAQSIVDPAPLSVARLAELLGPDPALALRVFVESPSPDARLTTATMEAAVRELTPAKRFAIDDDATSYLVLSVVHEARGDESHLSLMLCVEGPLWTRGSMTLPIDAASDPDHARQAWVRLWCRHTLGSGPTASIAALSRGLANELLDLLSSEFAPLPAPGGPPSTTPDPDSPSDGGTSGPPAPDGAPGG